MIINGKIGKSMNVLVTGADGQLGMSLRKIAGEYPSCAFMFAGFPEYDVADAGCMASLIESAKPDVIVNCAAYTAVDRAESEPDEARRTNALGVAVLASLARERGIGLVQISTDYVFDGTSRRPYKENDAVNPHTVYGLTKLEGENAVRESGADTVIVRTSWLYSEFGNNFVRTMLRLAEEKEFLKVVDDQRGSPTYATDLARAVIVLINKGLKGFDIYHYSGCGDTTWYGFAKEIFSLAGKRAGVIPVATADYPSAAHRPLYSVLDTAKIRGTGAIVRPWRESLAECLRNLGY